MPGRAVTTSKRPCFSKSWARSNLGIALLKSHQLSALILDDQALIRSIVRENLHAMGFKDIRTAPTVLEAEKEMREKEFDIVFVDWLLPGENGISFLQRCRKQKAFDRVAFVMVTSQAEVQHVTAAMMAGATSYIIKPIVGRDFTSVVLTVIEWVNKARGIAGSG